MGKKCNFHLLNITNQKVLQHLFKRHDKQNLALCLYFLTPGNKTVFYPAEPDGAPPQQGMSRLPVTVREEGSVPPEAGLLPHAEAAV